MSRARLVGLVGLTIAAAWLAARANRAQNAWSVPAPASPVATSAATFEAGVSYAGTSRWDEPAPDQAALPLPTDDEPPGLPAHPMAAWLEARLCEADETLLQRLVRADAGNEPWSAMAEDCGAGSKLCLVAAAAADAGVVPAAPLQNVYAAVLSRCDVAALGPWMDAGWLPLRARLAWLGAYGSTTRVDPAVWDAVRLDGGFEAMFDAAAVFQRAPGDEDAARRLIALRREAPRTQSAVLEMLLRTSTTKVATDYFAASCAARDGGCPWNAELPADPVELRDQLVNGSRSPAELFDRDGGLRSPAAVDALAACALSRSELADDCLMVLADADWSAAHLTAKRLAPTGIARTLRRFPTRSQLEEAWDSCGADAGLPLAPFLESQRGRFLFPRVDSIWRGVRSLAEVPAATRAARTEADQATLSAWLHGQRLDVVLPAGCSARSEASAVGLANVVLRELGEKSRVYVVTSWPMGTILVALDESKANCLRDAGVLEPLPAEALETTR